jgi:hypothetical protein
MKYLLIILLSAFSAHSNTFDITLAPLVSTAKGGLGAHYTPTNSTLTYGLLFATDGDFVGIDVGAGVSWRPLDIGLYLFQSYYWMRGGAAQEETWINRNTGEVITKNGHWYENALGVFTGIGYQHLWGDHFLVFADAAIPVFFTTDGIKMTQTEGRYYDTGVEFRLGFGLGYRF